MGAQLLLSRLGMRLQLAMDNSGKLKESALCSSELKALLLVENKPVHVTFLRLFRSKTLHVVEAT